MAVKGTRARRCTEVTWQSCDGRVKLYRGDCLRVLDDVRLCGIDAIVTDPPYGEGRPFDDVNTPHEAAALLSEALSRITLPLNGLACVFWTMRSLDLLIDALKQCGLTYRRTLTMYVPNGSARPFRGWLPRTQPIVVAQRYSPRRSAAFHGKVAAYLKQALARSAMTKAQVAQAVGCDPRLVRKWTTAGDPGWCLPTPRFYQQLKQILDLDNTFDCLLSRSRASAQPGREFDFQHDCYVVETMRKAQMHHPA